MVLRNVRALRKSGLIETARLLAELADLFFDGGKFTSGFCRQLLLTGSPLVKFPKLIGEPDDQ